jgi:hypothetical protein
MPTRIALTCVAILGALFGCGNNLEITTAQPVEVLLLPKRVGTEGQKQVGLLPAGMTVPIKDSVLAKDGTAYEIEFIDPVSKTKVKGYVLLGSPGLKVREKT